MTKLIKTEYNRFAKGNLTTIIEIDANTYKMTLDTRIEKGFIANPERLIAELLADGFKKL